MGCWESFGLLANYFLELFENVNLLGIVLVVLAPTWTMGGVGCWVFAKRLDRFLLAESLGDHIGRFQSWASTFGVSEHKPIFLYLDLKFSHSYPFKFDRAWLEEGDFCELVRHKCNSYIINDSLSPIYKLTKKT